MSTLVPKKSRDDVYRYLFTEGVLCCMKNRLGKWQATLGGKRIEVPTIQVMVLLRALKSRGLIKEQFAWRHYYWFLNDNGVAFLRKYLFKEGVMVAKKDTHSPKHPALEKVPNLHVIKALQSLKSRGYVKEQFAWRHYYWYLTNEGIQYLRDFLHLPPEIVPPTLKRTMKAGGERGDRGDREGRPPRGDGERGFGGERGERGDGGYRRREPIGEGQDRGFRGGFGRGKPAPGSSAAE